MTMLSTRSGSSASGSNGLALSGSAARLAEKRPDRRHPGFEYHGPRPADTWPQSNARAIGLDDHLGETALAKALTTKFSATFRECHDIQAVREAATILEEQLKKHQFTHRSLVVAVNQRCCDLLVRGWSNPEQAIDDLKHLHELRVGRLLSTWKTVREAIVRALMKLTSGDGVQWRSSTSALHGPGESPRQALHVWTMQTHVFCQYCEAGFVAPEDAHEVEKSLDVELRQIMTRIPSTDLLKYGAYLRSGGGYLLRARAAVAAARHMLPPDTIVPVPVLSDLPPEVPSSISAAAFDALRKSQRAGGEEERAASRAGEELHQLGLDDPERLLSPLGRRPSKSLSDSRLFGATSSSSPSHGHDHDGHDHGHGHEHGHDHGSHDHGNEPPQQGHQWAASPQSAGGTPTNNVRAAALFKGQPGLAHQDVLRRASALHIVRGHVGKDARPTPSHRRGEVWAGVGAVGSMGFHSGGSVNGVAPVGGTGMSALQKALLQVHASRGKTPFRQDPSSPSMASLVALGRAAPRKA
mmetsp:Transcript_47726/g.102268  ORF Transcript_47726/g.102268 Transcript_47726/m.102268 type:complete len:525 (+) Transcript_47726:267-1841(+)|eukprot:CAMPEP_0206426112 /NCGR_PEP_ID=MMETSP0324_2-20121206/4185_1 /ASSEMBLY_ACC=CAM_ASM_000836 /TAXON_ID=2866 /ORGANISM="Crypthecodinium cohnii, Strain Seligo" /LENGTH=524 /DNA_ID=CAMNT_0053891007 /DNA_START=185 /DNA_END=1759 /DNA_ORIENTATION=+